jgi:mRNA interferase RelE/StbE
MGYTVTFKASALKQTQKLPKQIAARVLAKSDGLGSNPRPAGCEKLAGATNLWRVRVGDYRIVYLIDDERQLVDVRVVAHRREVYRDLCAAPLRPPSADDGRNPVAGGRFYDGGVPANAAGRRTYDVTCPCFEA